MDIGVLIVTFNRLDCLKTTLQQYDLQTKKPAYILVVDNHSTDGTNEYLEHWSKEPSSIPRYVIRASENLGGSGGFSIGEERALGLPAEWIWHADDDAIPDIDALEQIENCHDLILKHQKDAKIVSISAAIRSIDTGESIGKLVRVREGLIFTRWYQVFFSEVPYVQIDRFTYLGTTIRKRAIETAGVTNADFFIHEDDHEHAYRLRKVGGLYASEKAIIRHPDWIEVNDVKQMNWKFYYTLRNTLVSIRYNFRFRYFVQAAIRSYARLCFHVLKGYPQSVLKMEWDAIKDGVACRIGKNKRYLPS